MTDIPQPQVTYGGRIMHLLDLEFNISQLKYKGVIKRKVYAYYNVVDGNVRMTGLSKNLKLHEVAYNHNTSTVGTRYSKGPFEAFIWLTDKSRTADSYQLVMREGDNFFIVNPDELTSRLTESQQKDLMKALGKQPDDLVMKL